MDTFALFDNGMASKVLLEFFEPGKKHIEPEPEDIDDAQVIASAARGFSAAYQVLRTLGYIVREKYCFAYAFDGAFYAIGTSAGLVWCLKLTQELYRLCTGNELTYSIAATGVILYVSSFPVQR